MYLNKEEIQALSQRRRALFINSLSGFKSANLVGSVSKAGQTNLAIVSSVFHLGADPALMGMIFRPHSVSRDSLENILDTGFYTLNGVGEEFFRLAHQTSARYPSDVSEFEAVGLTGYFNQSHPAPYVAESPLQIGLKYIEHQTLEVNGTVMLVGEVVEVSARVDTLSEDGYLDVEALGLVAVSSLDSYHTTSRLGRLAYAKPGLPVRDLICEPDQSESLRPVTAGQTDTKKSTDGDALVEVKIV
ncbi:flavin reductase family protein [Shewanella submarina]|uniref:Flavin reductase family protein n=1 Tax=Shewanella submarina TaxID=2016376 RepID=A0ABV7GMT9_9GAMM|nr:flavin reductase [Shewanella submarina]MCL1036113.1 flavin reductase family protein [Shewanella submarina]